MPEDPAIFVDAAQVRVDDVNGYRVRPFNAVTTFTPRELLSNTLGSLEAVGLTQSVASVPESGLLGADSQVRFARVTDPDSPSRMAYLMRLDQGDASLPTDGVKQRIEVVDGASTRRLQHGRRYWVAWAVRLPSLWKQANPTLTGNPHANKDETLIWQVHESPDSWDVGSNPSIVYTVVGGGAATPFNSFEYITIRTNPNLISSGASQNIVREVWRNYDYPADTWQWWVWDLVLHWDRNQRPHTRAWRAVGSGPLVQIINDSEPNHYHNTEDKPYIKHGMYYYAAAWTGGITSRVMHSKGLHVWNHVDGMSESGALQYLRGI